MNRHDLSDDVLVHPLIDRYFCLFFFNILRNLHRLFNHLLNFVEIRDLANDIGYLEHALANFFNQVDIFIPQRVLIFILQLKGYIIKNIANRFGNYEKPSHKGLLVALLGIPQHEIHNLQILHSYISKSPICPFAQEGKFP